MFGKHDPLRDGAQARAVVIAAKRSGGVPVDGGYSPVKYDLGLRVRFADGSTAEVSRHVGGLWKGTALSFSEGDIVPVRYDRTDPSKLEVDVPAMETSKATNAAQAKQAAISRADASLAAELRSAPGAPGSTREYVRAELERARRFNTPIGVRVSQKLQEANAAGEIQTEGGDELAMRQAFDQLRDEIRREVTEQQPGHHAG
jgi:hypothetical protein